MINQHASTQCSGKTALPLFLYLAFEAVHGASSCFVGVNSAPDCAHPSDDELQVPESYARAQSHIGRTNRRLYAGMVGALDEGVGNVSEALERTGLAWRTLVLFTTDNGGACPNQHDQP